MKRIILQILFFLNICSIISLLLGSCNQTAGPDFDSAEFVGVWLYSAATPDELTMTTTTFFKDVGLGAGTMECSITSYDENANHIEMSTTSATGIFTYPTGTVLYMKYSVSGNELFMEMFTTDYPPSATQGPYIKQ